MPRNRPLFWALCLFASLASSAFASGTTPVALDMQITAVSEKPRAFSLFAGDGETPTNRVECQIVLWPTNGALTFALPASYPTNSRSVVYTSTSAYLGPDSFTFRATDGTLTSELATCIITVTSNETPVALPTSKTAA